MTKIIGSPTRYIQGKGELKKLAAHASSLGKKLFVIVDKNIQDIVKPDIELSVKAQDVDILFESFQGECCMSEINRIIDIVKTNGCDVIVGVGGGTTAGKRVESIALDAELHGATAVVLNAPTATEFVQNLADDIDVVLTIVSLNEDLEKRMLHTKANIINVSGGKDTVKIVKKLREIDPNFPIIATGGPTEETVREVIQAGANAVTFTPPTNGEIFKGMMEEYRHRYD